MILLSIDTDQDFYLDIPLEMAFRMPVEPATILAYLRSAKCIAWPGQGHERDYSRICRFARLALKTSLTFHVGNNATITSSLPLTTDAPVFGETSGDKAMERARRYYESKCKFIEEVEAQRAEGATNADTSRSVPTSSPASTTVRGS